MHLVQIAARTPAAQAWEAHPRGVAGGEFAALLDLWLAAVLAAAGSVPQGVACDGVPEAAEGGLHAGTAAGVRRHPNPEAENGRPTRESLDCETGTVDPWAGPGGASWVWPFTHAAAYPLSSGAKCPVPRVGGSAPARDDPFPETDCGHLECFVRPEALLAAAATPPCVAAPVAGPKVEGVQAAAGFWAAQPTPGPFSAVPAVEGCAEDPGPAPGGGSRGTVVAGRLAKKSAGVPVDGVLGPQALSGTGGRPEGTGQPEGHPGTVFPVGASATEDRATWGPGPVREGPVPAGSARSAPVGRTGGPYEGPVAVATVAGSASGEQAARDPDLTFGLGHRPGFEGAAADSGLPARMTLRAVATVEVDPSGFQGREVWRRLAAVRGNAERVSGVLAANLWRVGPRDGSASVRPGWSAPSAGPADAGNLPQVPAAVLNPGEGSAAKAMYHLAEKAFAAEAGALTAQGAPACGDPPAGVPGEATSGPQTVPQLQGPAPRYAEGRGEDAAATGTPRSVEATSGGVPEGGDAAGAATEAEGRQRDGGTGAVPGWRGTAFEPPAASETPVRGTDRRPTGTVAPREAEAGTAVAAAGPLRVMHEGHHPPEAERVPPGVVPERVLAAVRHLAKTGEGQVRLELELDPPALGRLVVRLAWDDGVLRADFLVASHQARQAVEAFLPCLRENLAGLVTLAETGVWVYPDTMASGWWQPARHHQEPLPGAAVPVSEREAEPVFRGWPHGGVLDCLI